MSRKVGSGDGAVGKGAVDVDKGVRGEWGKGVRGYVVKEVRLCSRHPWM